ncbi:hypothetical protein [Mesorhizobium sp. B2-6-6]|uniref:hypothetical protein n=2 Tax=Bacteria TaxID=2 RepID=UPI001128D9FD|nr:hypothetical protein FJ437_32965 [Mesorhizobium sp. B2-6-6]VWX45496.1 conserved exported hypothetical protein [Micrococcus sp. 116]
MLTRSRAPLGSSLLAAATLTLMTFAAAPAALAAGDADCLAGFCVVKGEIPGAPGGGDLSQPVQPVSGEPKRANFCEVNTPGDQDWKTPYNCDTNWDPVRECVWQIMAPQPAPPAGKDPTRGAWEQCAPQNALLAQQGLPTRWMDSTAAAATTPAEAARQLITQMNLKGVEMGMVPRSVASDSNAMGAVGLPAWMWVKNTHDPQAWGPYTVAREIDGLSVTGTARPLFVTWDMGDGQQVVCNTGGTPYSERYGREESPSCGYTYKKTGQYDVTAVTTWAVEWSAGGESGVIETVTRSSQPVVIGELQAVNVKPGG